MNGMEMMMKSFGIDPARIMKDFADLKDGVIKSLGSIDTQLKAIAQAQITICNHIEAIEKRQEELWQMNQRALTMSSQVQLVPQPQNQQQPMQPEKQSLPEVQPNPQRPM